MSSKRKAIPFLSILSTSLFPISFSMTAASLLTVSCSSAPEIKKQKYAELNPVRTFENDFPTVWNGIEASLRQKKILQRDPDEVNSLELKKLTHRSLETDWIYGQSRDKYHEYTLNGVPRKKALQTRLKYFVDAQRVMGGVTVSIRLQEEVEQLNSDGTPASYKSVDEVDSSRASDLLDQIYKEILAAHI